jgi:CheY-like chemotaxis protein
MTLCYSRLRSLMKYSSSPHPNILLVDDNHDGLLVRRTVLEEQGYCVTVAANGVEALEIFTSSHFDVVVTSHSMRSMGGVDLIRRIREVKPQARVVLLSGEPLGLTEEKTGADAIVAKNNNEPANLLRSVRRLIHRAPMRKQPVSQSRLVARARA